MKKKKWRGGREEDAVRLGNMPLPCRDRSEGGGGGGPRHVANSKRRARHCRSRGMR